MGVLEQSFGDSGPLGLPRGLGSFLALSWSALGGLEDSLVGLGRCEPPSVVYARNAHGPKEMRR
eukprot:70658-Pyramimonas_sp.AAC.1